MCIVHDNTCNNNCHLRKNAIISRDNYIPFAIKTQGGFHSLFKSLFIYCIQAIIGHHQQYYLAPMVLISCFHQRVPIAFQHVQSIVIFQCVATLEMHSSSIPHIVANGSSTNQFVINNAFSIYSLLFYQCISGVLVARFFHDMCSFAFICLVFLGDGFPSLAFFFCVQGSFSFSLNHHKAKYNMVFLFIFESNSVHGQYFNQLERASTISLHGDKQVKEILYFWLESTCQCEPPLI